MQVRQFLKENGIQAQRKFSQNFILKQEFLSKFQNHLKMIQETKQTSLVLEIGPGTTLTSKMILKLNPLKLVGVEIDSRFCPLLEVGCRVLCVL